MHTTATLTRKFEAWWCGMLPLLSNGGVAAQQSPSPLKAEEIDALFAPIALCVDALLTQMAMARLEVSPTGILEPLRDRHIGARRGSAYWSQGVIAAMEPVADRHIGAR
jgi:hypothetical protein